MMRSRRLTIGVAVLMFALGATAAGAITGGTTRSAGSQVGIQVATGTQLSLTSSQRYEGVSGAATTFTVSQKVLVVATFSAQTECFDGTLNSLLHCRIRILVDNTEMNPKSGDDGTFAFSNHGSYDIGAASIQRSLVVGPGTHAVLVEQSVSTPQAAFYLTTWQLTTTESANPV
jgi:hypothetical protein